MKPKRSAPVRWSALLDAVCRNRYVFQILIQLIASDPKCHVRICPSTAEPIISGDDGICLARSNSVCGLPKNPRHMHVVVPQLHSISNNRQEYYRSNHSEAQSKSCIRLLSHSVRNQ